MADTGWKILFYKLNQRRAIRKMKNEGGSSVNSSVIIRKALPEDLNQIV